MSEINNNEQLPFYPNVPVDWYEEREFLAALESLDVEVKELQKTAEVQILSALGGKIDNLLLGGEASASTGSFREVTLEGGRTGIITSIDSTGANQYRVVVEGKVKPIRGEQVLMKKFFAWDVDSPEAEDKRKAWVQNPRAIKPEDERQGFTLNDFKEISKVLSAFEKE